MLLYHNACNKKPNTGTAKKIPHTGFRREKYQNCADFTDCRTVNNQQSQDDKAFDPDIRNTKKLQDFSHCQLQSDTPTEKIAPAAP